MLRDPGSIQEAYNMPPQQQPKFRRPSVTLEQSTPPVYPPKERPSLLSLRQVAADAPRTPPSNASEDYPQVFDPAAVNIYSAVYSGVAVLEMMSRGIAVMRRRADSYLNATQILKVAGIDKGKRTKILEREILQGHHEKVQGGYGKYQGTWVPFQRGRELAEQYGVEHYLRPLFMYDISLADGRFDKTPTKEQAMAAQKKEAAARGDSPAQPASRKRHKANSVSQHNANSSQNSCGTVSSQHSIQVLPGPPVPEPQAAERNRAILMAIFLNEDPNQVPDLLADPNFPTDIDIDLIIDDQGMTALHWSATLARINISRLLVDRGANVCRFNYASETPLIRSVLVTNNYDNQTFFDLLGLLHPSLAAVDYRMRSVLHHIALTAGIFGREHAARYYMECILEWIARNGGNFSRLIDLQDKNGDTALNLAARVGDPSLVRQLLDVGANQFLINRAGLKLSDFGMTIHDPSFSLPDAQYRSGMDQAQVAADAASVQAYINNDSDVVEQKSIPSSPESKVKFEASTAPRTGKRARELVDNDQSVEQIVDDLEGDYETELVRVKEELTETRQTLRSTTCELATLRRQLFALRSQYDQLEMATQKITNCEMAIQTESKYNGSLPMTAPHSPCRDQYHGGSHDRRSSHIPTTPPASIKGDGNPGRDGSCLVSANVSDDESSESAVRSLRVRTGRYARGDVDVKPEIDQLKRNAAIRELQCKQLISSCCNLPIATVDGLLATLSKAVNSDGSKVDMDRVKSLISMVTRDEGLGAHVVSTGAREH